MDYKAFDPELWQAIENEGIRQQNNLELIASENIVSKGVLAAQGSILTNKYAEGYPNKRYYGGCEFVDVVETLAIERAKELFGAKFANVQPHSGSQANTAAYLALIEPGDTVLGMDLSAGGHLTHGSPVNFSGKTYHFVGYGVDPTTEVIDYDVVRILAREHQPKLIVADEPTGNLDTVNSHELLGMLTKLNQEGTSIILVTHDSMIASYAKKFIYLRDGKIINEINRNNASQVDFFNEIVKITTQDSLLKLFNDTTDSKNVFSNNIDSSVTNSEVVIENEDNNKVSETSNNEGMEVNVINKETKPVRRIVYAIFAGLEYDESSSKRYRILHFEEDTIDFQFSNIEKLHVTYPEVEKAIISMCSRYVPSFPMPENRFYLDLDLVLKDGKTYKFEVNNQRNATSLFDVLHQHNIKVEDPCGFEELYRSKGDYLVRHRWLLYNFRKIAKQYHLDNPRGESKSFY